jgi:hypothetical protein
MGLAGSTAIAVSEPPVAKGRSAHEVEAAIAAWLSVVGDRHSRLRQVLRGATEVEFIPDYLDFEEAEIDQALLKRMLVGLARIPA